MPDIDVIARIEGDVENGGWQASGVVVNDADLIDFYQEIEVWFDLYIKGSGWERLPRPAFIGHLNPETIQKTFQTSKAPLRAFTSQEFLKDRDAEIQGIFFKHVASSPGNDHQIVSMTYADIVGHIMGQAGEYGHCNLVRDVWPEGFVTLNLDTANSSAVSSYDLKKGNFWTRLQEIADIDFYYLFFSKANVLNFVQHPMFGTLPTPALDLTSSLLLEPLAITPRNVQVGQVKLRGQTPAGLQITGIYPTDPTAGRVIERAGYMATSNAKMTTIAERMYKFENRSHTVEAKVRGGVGLLLDLMDRVSITYASAADGISWSAKKFWVHRIVVEVLTNFTARSTLLLEAENA